jgi:hypothetical protein
MLKMNKQEYIEHAVRDGGLILQEAICSYAILEAWDAYQHLSIQHPSELDEALIAIHTLQNLLAIRVARRDHPLFWRNEESSAIEH